MTNAQILILSVVCVLAGVTLMAIVERADAAAMTLIAAGIGGPMRVAHVAQRRAKAANEEAGRAVSETQVLRIHNRVLRKKVKELGGDDTPS